MGLEARGAWFGGLERGRSGANAGGEHLGYLEDFVGRGFSRRSSVLGGRRSSLGVFGAMGIRLRRQICQRKDWRRRLLGREDGNNPARKTNLAVYFLISRKLLV
jgi:hypothetical protein